MRILIVNYDNQNSAAESWFPQGLAYIYSGLEMIPGAEIRVLDLNILHKNELLQLWLDRYMPHVIILSFIGGYWQYKQFKELITRINQHPRREKIYVLAGGHLFAPATHYFLTRFGVDCIAIGDGENIKELIEKQPRGVQHLKSLDIDSLPWPAYSEFNISHYRLLRMPNCDKTDFCLPVLSSRGCPFRCSFCYRLDEGVRLRDTRALVDELKYLILEYQISYFAFADELLMMNEARAVEVAEALAPLKIKWDCNGRLNYAKPEVLKVMKDAGCVFINYGIEALDDNVLKLMRKNLDVQTIIEGVENTLRAGISPGLNILWGSPGDDRETLWKAVDFLLHYDDHAQLRTIRPVTPYPGSQLYDDAVDKGLINDVEDFYERKHINSDLFTCNFMDMPLEEANQLLCAANKRLIRAYFQRRQVSYEQQAEELYLGNNPNFRGYRQR